jgi:hypothetical protein
MRRLVFLCRDGGTEQNATRRPMLGEVAAIVDLDVRPLPGQLSAFGPARRVVAAGRQAAGTDS